jgi:hypothetical protein
MPSCSSPIDTHHSVYSEPITRSLGREGAGERQAKTGGTRVIVSLMPGDNVADQLALTSPRTIDARAMGQVTACVESGLPPLDERASP